MLMATPANISTDYVYLSSKYIYNKMSIFLHESCIIFILIFWMILFLWQPILYPQTPANYYDKVYKNAKICIYISTGLKFIYHGIVITYFIFTLTRRHQSWYYTDCVSVAYQACQFQSHRRRPLHMFLTYIHAVS